MRFILVGGLAANVHGYDRPTEDVDVTPERDSQNLARLRAALQELGAELRVAGLDSGVPDVFAERRFRQPSVTLVTRKGFLDLAFDPDGIASYAELAGVPRSVVFSV